MLAGKVQADAPQPVAPAQPPGGIKPDVCLTTGYAVFMFYAGEQTTPANASPAPGPCWTYSRPIQEGSYFYTCSVNPWYNWHTYGSSSAGNKSYDDTNTSHTGYGGDSGNISTCLGGQTNLWGDFMAHTSTGWHTSLPSGVSYTYAFAELYSGDTGSDVYTDPSFAYPVINANAYTGQALYNEVVKQCYDRSPYVVAIYADHTLSTGDQGELNAALNHCYTN